MEENRKKALAAALGQIKKQFGKEPKDMSVAEQTKAAIWEMNGTVVVGGGLVGSNPGPSWVVKGSGDFNADGYADILWQNTDGQAAIWGLNGTSVIGGGLVSSNPGPTWQVIGTGDFNGDRYSDILCQNINGEVAVWELIGMNVIGAAILGNPGAD